MCCPCWPKPRIPTQEYHIVVEAIDKPLVTPTPVNTPTNPNVRIEKITKKTFVFIYGGR